MSFEKKIEKLFCSELATNFFIKTIGERIGVAIERRFDGDMSRIIHNIVLHDCAKFCQEMTSKIDEKYKKLEKSIDRMIEDELKKSIDSYFKEKKVTKRR